MNIHLSTNENQKRQKKHQQVLGMLIIQVVIYVTTTTMTSINLLYSVLTMYFKTNKSNEENSIETFVSFIMGMLNYSCPCLSFYLFILASHLCREQMKLVMLYICRQCYSLDCREGHMKKNSLCVCLQRGQKNIIYI